MLVGLTYDLREDYRDLGLSAEELAEFDSPRTVEAVEEALLSLGFQTERVGHVFSLVQALAAGKKWDMVFNIAEGLRGFGRESQVPCLLEAYGLPYTFSDPLTLSLTLHKGMTKHVLKSAGVPTPDFVVVSDPAEAELINLPLPLFAKPVAEGTGKGVTAASRITDRSRLVEVCRRLLEDYRQPVLVETYLPGREFTVGILGTGPAAKSLGVMEILLRPEAEDEVYSFLNKELFKTRVDYRLVDDECARAAARTALEAWNVLGGRDAGRTDLRCDAAGTPSFMEVNPLAGLHPEHSDLPILCALGGMSFQGLIEGIMDSALTRAGLVRPAAPAVSHRAPAVSHRVPAMSVGPMERRYESPHPL